MYRSPVSSLPRTLPRLRKSERTTLMPPLGVHLFSVVTIDPTAVRRHLQHRTAPLVHDQHVAELVSERDVWAREIGVGSPAPLEGRLPITNMVPVELPAPRDRLKNAVCLQQIRVMPRGIGRNV